MGGRATSLSPAERFLLEHWSRVPLLAFGTYPYLVGSVARGERNWRDVDVRMMLDRDQFDALTGNPVRLRTLNAAFSLWSQRATGLPIDFQFQETTEANAEYGGPRVPLGISLARSAHSEGGA